MNCGLCCGIFKGPRRKEFELIPCPDLWGVSDGVSEPLGGVDGFQGSSSTTQDRRGCQCRTSCGKPQNFRMLHPMEAGLQMGVARCGC